MTPTIDLLCSHRSIRAFTDQPVSEAQREAIITAAQSASTSSFLQCSSIIRITDKALRDKLVTLTGDRPGSRMRLSSGSSALTLIATCRFAQMRSWSCRAVAAGLRRYRADGSECHGRSGIAGSGRRLYRRNP